MAFTHKNIIVYQYKHMPRPSLPPSLKNLSTYSVVLTQTTEEDLWKHFVNSLPDYEGKMDAYYSRICDVVDNIHHNNPYENSKWRRGYVEKKYQTFTDWFGTNEDDMRQYLDLRAFKHEFKRCVDVFEWDKDEEKRKVLNQMLYDYTRPIDRINDMESSMKETDNFKYIQSKTKWQNEDKAWIEESKKKQDHLTHRPREYYIELFAKDPLAVKYYKNTIPNNEETCEYCITQKRIKQEVEEKERREEEEKKQRELEEQEEKSRREQERIEELRNRPVITYTCEDCNYTSKNKYTYNDHLESKEHRHIVKQKQTFCVVCNTQCRSPFEYANHIKSAKHLKNENGENKAEYTCEPCGYTTKLKQHYDIHCVSKKHQKTVEV